MTSFTLQNCDSRLSLIQAKIVADLEASHGSAFAASFLLEHSDALVRASNTLSLPLRGGQLPVRHLWFGPDG